MLLVPVTMAAYLPSDGKFVTETIGVYLMTHVESAEQADHCVWEDKEFFISRRQNLALPSRVVEVSRVYASKAGFSSMGGFRWLGKSTFVCAFQMKGKWKISLRDYLRDPLNISYSKRDASRIVSSAFQVDHCVLKNSGDGHVLKFHSPSALYYQYISKLGTAEELTTSLSTIRGRRWCCPKRSGQKGQKPGREDWQKSP